MKRALDDVNDAIKEYEEEVSDMEEGGDEPDSANRGLVALKKSREYVAIGDLTSARRFARKSIEEFGYKLGDFA